MRPDTESGFAGPYRLIGELGEGGMGVVRLAVAPDGRAVAVKMLRPAFAADPEARRRMAREVETLRRVRSPFVAEVLDADPNADPPYLVTAYVPGATLDARVADRGPLSTDDAIRLGRQMIDALEAIHLAGVVHRDVKPSNVLVLDGAPVLIDFGIAHINDESRITSSGLVMGTPGYLPPEVLAGMPLTMATDWWGWGATMAYAVTGRQPFGHGPAAVVLDRVRQGNPDLDGVEPHLAQVLRRAMSTEPSERLGAAGLLQALQQISPGTPPIPSFPAAAAAAALAPALPQPAPTPPTATPAPSSPSAPAAAAASQQRTEVIHQGTAGARTEVPAPPSGHPVQAPAPASVRPLTPTVLMPGYDGSGTAQAPPAQAPVVLHSGPQVPVPVHAQPDPTLAPPPEPSASPQQTIALTLALLLTALSAMSSVVPGLVVVIGAIWLVAARAADRTMAATAYRRHTYGPRSTDVGLAVAALPWRVLVSIPRAALAMIVPVALAVSAAFVVASVVSPGSPDPTGPWALAVAGLVGYLAAWWGPSGVAVRRPTRLAARGLATRRRMLLAVRILLVMLTVAAVLVASRGTAADWWPLAWPTIELPAVQLPGLPSWLNG